MAPRRGRLLRGMAALAVGLVAVVAAWGDRLFPVDDLAEKPRPRPVARVAARAERPNLVVVFGCTVRRDQMELYGGPPTMPWVRRLGENGAVFEDALSVSSWTRASAVGVLTGRHPLSFGLPEPGPKQSRRVLPGEARTLAEIVRDAGYHTIGLTANPNLNAQYGMAQGMDVYQDAASRAFRNNRSGAELVEDALQALDRRTAAQRQRPFYLQLMLIDAHHPRRPPPEEVERWREPGISRMVATYRASLGVLDRALDALDRGLEQRGYDADNTVWVFMADHGEGLNSPPHHGPGHGKKMYPSTVQIPLVIRGPGVLAGHRVEGMVSGVDLLPTLLGLLGVEEAVSGPGQDLSSWVRGERKDRLPRRRAFAYSMFHRADVGSVWTPTRQCQAHFEFDRDREVNGCFDRVEDPYFERPLEDRALLAELVRWREARMAEGARWEVRTTEVGEALRRQLEALGYAEPRP